jgi:hypothetical protein
MGARRPVRDDLRIAAVAAFPADQARAFMLSCRMSHSRPNVVLVCLYNPERPLPSNIWPTRYFEKPARRLDKLLARVLPRYAEIKRATHARRKT